MDKRVIAAARSGNVRARANLINQLQEPWYRMQLAIRLDPVEAFDRTLESALAALKSLPELLKDDAAEPRALWLGTSIATGTLTRLPAARAAGLTVAASRTSDHTQKLLIELGKIFSLLTQPQRIAMVLLVFEAQSSQQLADVAGASRETLRRDLAAAFRSIRRANPGRDARRLLAPVIELYRVEKFPGDLRASLFQRRKVGRSLPIALIVMAVSLVVILTSQGLKHRMPTTTTAPATSR